jgi:UDPglucose 6-dehydrogenase/GDP-mannose 6-dehydrogenase
MRVTIVGAGYVGLVTGACLAETGHEVYCADLNRERTDRINAGVCPILEPGLETLIAAHAGKRLQAGQDLVRQVAGSDISMICTGTPFDGKQIDLSSVISAARSIGEGIRDHPGYHVVVVKSTVVPGTTDGVVAKAVTDGSGKAPGADFGLGMNPEFLSEGSAVHDFMNPDRIVIGGMDERSRDAVAALYGNFVGVPVLRTTNRTAEMIKYASNCLLATMISFSNEMANLAAALGDVEIVDVMHGVHLMRELNPQDESGRSHSASMRNFLFPGCGYGGSCFPKDTRALAAHAEAHQSPMRLLNAVIRTNDDQPRRMIKLLGRFYESLEGLPVTVLGVAFKPGTDDVRESPAFPVIDELLSRGAGVTLHDPAGLENARAVLGEAPVRYVADLDEAIRDAKALLLVTRWPEYADLHHRVGRLNPAPVVIDGRRFLDPGRFPAYAGIGT